MTDELMRDFSLDAGGLSTLVAFFYYGYTPMQLPGGLLYDRFGPRAVITFAAILCTLGDLFFCTAHSYALAAFGRFLMGAGGAMSFVGVLLLTSRWLPKKYFAVAAGLLQFLGSIAAIVAQVPLASVVKYEGWRPMLWQIFFVGVVIVIILPLVVRNYPDGVTPPPKKKLFHGEMHNLKLVLKKSQTWIVALYSFLSWAPVTVFGGLWGVKFISEIYGASITEAAGIMSALWIGVALGSPFFGWLSEFVGRRRMPLALPAFIGFLATVCVVYLHMSMFFMIIALFFFGVGTSGQTLSFAVVQDNNTPTTVGTAMGFNNLCVVAGGAICQPFVGHLMNLFWNGSIQNGIHFYDVSTFQKALFIVPASFLLCALVGRIWIKETYCRHVWE
jgi:MFS family permease